MELLSLQPMFRPKPFDFTLYSSPVSRKVVYKVGPKEYSIPDIHQNFGGGELSPGQIRIWGGRCTVFFC